MPKLGEIKTNYELGKKRRCHYQWYACPDCGKESWKQLRYGKVDALRCNSCAHIGENSPFWKGGRIIDKDTGYVDVRVYPNDFFYSMAAKNGYAREHRLIMAKYLNRCLLPWEVVHHKNGIKTDNRLENLQLLPSSSIHLVDTQIKRHIKYLGNLIEKQSKQILLLQKQLREIESISRGK